MTVPFPQQSPRGETYPITLKADMDDRMALQDQAKLNGLNQTDVLHLFFEMMRLRIVAAQSQGNQSVDKFSSPLEAFIWLTAQDSGLVSAEDVQVGASYIKDFAGGSKFKDRMGGLFEKLQARFVERYGGIDARELDEIFITPFEAVDDDHPARLAAEIKQRGNQADTNADAGE